jgi:uncharacterized protein DUF2750
MTWQLDDAEFEAVLALPPQKRYELFVHRAAAGGVVWSLARETSWAVTGDEKGYELVPVWPHERFAMACAAGHWAGYEPRCIPLEQWLERWLSGLQRDQRRVAVFPTPREKGLSVAPERLKQDLEAKRPRTG